jgi:hypothetical protein
MYHCIRKRLSAFQVAPISISTFHSISQTPPSPLGSNYPIRNVGLLFIFSLMHSAVFSTTLTAEPSVVCAFPQNVDVHHTDVSTYYTCHLSDAYERSLMDRQYCCCISVFTLEGFLYLMSFMALYVTPLIINKIYFYNTKIIRNLILFMYDM